MPTISMFYGIIIRMFRETQSKHNFPHIHAKYNEYEVVSKLDGTILEGKFPLKQERLLLAWIELHTDELNANWKLLEDGEPAFKIEPLK